MLISSHRQTMRLALLALLQSLVNSAPASDLYCGEDNCYDIIGVKRSATTDEIKKAYRKLALKLHPDRNKADDAEAVFSQLGRAWEVLGKHALREAYDFFLDNPESMRNYYNYYEAVYQPPVPIWACVLGLLSFMSLLQYINEWKNHVSTMNYIKKQAPFIRRVSEVFAEREKASKKKLQKSEKADLRTEIEDELIKTEVKLVGSGSKMPSVTDLYVVQAVMLPITIVRFCSQQFRWFWLYTVLKSEYGDAEKQALTMAALSIPEDSWPELGEATQTTLMGKSLWDKQKLAEFIEEERSLEQRGKKAVLTAYRRQAALSKRMSKEDDYYD